MILFFFFAQDGTVLDGRFSGFDLRKIARTVAHDMYYRYDRYDSHEYIHVSKHTFFLFWARFISSIVAGKIKDGRKNGKMRGEKEFDLNLGRKDCLTTENDKMMVERPGAGELDDFTSSRRKYCKDLKASSALQIWNMKLDIL